MSGGMISLVQSFALAFGSVSKAYHAFADLEICPPILARKIRKWTAVPPSFRELIPLQQSGAGIRQCGGRLLIQLKGDVDL